MPSISTFAPPAVSRYVASAIMSTILLLYGGASADPVQFAITKQTPTTATRNADMFTVKSSSGTGIACTGWGNCSFSGALTVDGVAISTGSSLSLSGGDARYVNQSGDTMTGTLVINKSSGNIDLNAIQTISGNVLFISKGATFAGTGVTISQAGAAVFNERGLDADFRIESQGNVNAFFLDASANSIGILTNAPKATLDIAGSVSGQTVFGRRCPQPISIELTASGTALTTGSGKLTFLVPRYLSGYSLAYARFSVDQAGTTGLTRIGIRNVEKGKRQLFSTNPSIDSGDTNSVEQASIATVINTANDDVGGGEHLSFDLLQTQTTAAKGLDAELEFSCP